MKKLILLCVAFISLMTTSSCDKDDDASLEGKWEYFKEGTANSSGQEFLTDYDHENGCAKDYTIINASSITDHNFFNSTCIEEIFSTPYTRNGNTITVTVEGETFTSEIKTLDSSTLKLYSANPDFPSTNQVTVLKRIN